MSSPRAKVNLRLYDIDHCLHHKYPGEKEELNPEQWVIENNKDFLAHEIADIKTNNYNHVIVGAGTNRQSKYIDDLNDDRGGSFVPTLPIVQSYLASQTDCPVKLDPFLMADIYSNTTAGESYFAILRELYCGSTEKHGFTIHDHSKISLLYAQAHRIAVLNPKADITITFTDDDASILLQLSKFYSNFSEMLPGNVTLQLQRYDGSPAKVKEKIQGKGEVDTQYDWSVRYISAKSYFFSGIKAGEDQDLKTAKELKVYHDDDHYHSFGHKQEMRVSRDFDVKEFLAFSKQEIPKLVSNPKIVNNENYTTAGLLSKHGLISKKLDLSKLNEEKIDNNEPGFCPIF